MKKKKSIVIIASLVLAGLAVFIFWYQKTAAGKEDVYYIGVAGPMSGKGKAFGTAMLQGIQLYLDRAKKEGKFGNRKLLLRIGDDRNEERRAMKVAADFASDPQMLLVLGHFYSGASVSAGEVYKQEGLPAISASATAEVLTLSNEWYFRVIPNNQLMARFIAYYSRYVLKKTSASIIFDRDIFGLSLMKNFENTAQELGIEIKKKWGFDRGNKELDRELKKIIAELRTMEDPGILFFATHLNEGVYLITLLKYPGTNYTIICSDSFSNAAQTFQKYPLERLRPGYYSDGIYAVTMFFKELGDTETVRFRNEYVKKYKEEPSWIAACYYDAMHTAAEAVELSEINRGEENIRENRRNIRDSLLSLNSADVGIQGVTAKIYFDKEKNVERPFGVGVYSSQKFMPAFKQYRLLSEDSANIRTGAGTDVVPINGHALSEISVVYAGVDINEVRDLDIKGSRCTLDFYLWFRFRGEFDDDTNIEFVNALEPVRLGEPMTEETIGDITVRTYHILGEFKTDFNFYTYPFDAQSLKIRFHHKDKTRNNMVYVPDIPGMEDENRGERIAIKELEGWKISNIWSHQDIRSISSGSYQKTEYSEFNAVIQIKRKWPGFIFKNFFPIFMVFLMLYAVCMVPFVYPAIRALILITGTLISASYHFMLLQNLSVNYLLIIEYALFAFYGLAAVSGAVSAGGFALSRRGQTNLLKFFIIGEKIIYFSGVLVTAGLLIYLFRR